MRLLIVDDDFQIREGMKNGIEWENLGIDEVFTCSNGVEAVQVFHEKNPEMIIADIQMPGMTGLEMLKTIREKNERARVIFISAYSEFDYCRQALLMGASDYVLKPIQMKAFMETVEKNILEIRQESNREEQYEQAILEQVIRNLYLFPKEDVEGDVLCEKLKARYPFMEGEYFLTVLLKWDKTREEKILGNKKCLVKFFQIENPNFVYFPVNGYILGIGEGNHSALMSVYQQNELAQRLRQWNQQYGKEYGTISAAISETHGKKEFRKGFLKAKEALAFGFYEGSAFLGICPAVPVKHGLSEEIQIYLEEKRKTLGSIHKQEDITFFKKMEILFKKENIDQELFKKSLLESYVEIYKQIKPMSKEKQKILQQEMDSCCYADECVDKIIQDYMASVWENTGEEGKTVREYSHTIQIALEYMHENCCTSINVDQVAEFVGKSSNYFSSIFKKETGFSFTEYITRLRMERARWLLLHTNKKIQEICEEVGYADYIYFSQLFKQHFGCTASKMRKQ